MDANQQDYLQPSTPPKTAEEQQNIETLMTDEERKAYHESIKARSWAYRTKQNIKIGFENFGNAFVRYGYIGSIAGYFSALTTGVILSVLVSFTSPWLAISGMLSNFGTAAFFGLVGTTAYYIYGKMEEKMDKFTEAVKTQAQSVTTAVKNLDPVHKTTSGIKKVANGAVAAVTPGFSWLRRKISNLTVVQWIALFVTAFCLGGMFAINKWKVKLEKKLKVHFADEVDKEIKKKHVKEAFMKIENKASLFVQVVEWLLRGIAVLSFFICTWSELSKIIQSTRLIEWVMKLIPGANKPRYGFDKVQKEVSKTFKDDLEAMKAASDLTSEEVQEESLKITSKPPTTDSKTEEKVRLSNPTLTDVYAWEQVSDLTFEMLHYAAWSRDAIEAKEFPKAWNSVIVKQFNDFLSVCPEAPVLKAFREVKAFTLTVRNEVPVKFYDVTSAWKRAYPQTKFLKQAWDLHKINEEEMKTVSSQIDSESEEKESTIPKSIKTPLPIMTPEVFRTMRANNASVVANMKNQTPIKISEIQEEEESLFGACTFDQKQAITGPGLLGMSLGLGIGIVGVFLSYLIVNAVLELYTRRILKKVVKKIDWEKEFEKLPTWKNLDADQKKKILTGKESMIRKKLEELANAVVKKVSPEVPANEEKDQTETDSPKKEAKKKKKKATPKSSEKESTTAPNTEDELLNVQSACETSGTDQKEGSGKMTRHRGGGKGRKGGAKSQKQPKTQKIDKPPPKEKEVILDTRAFPERIKYVPMYRYADEIDLAKDWKKFNVLAVENGKDKKFDSIYSEAFQRFVQNWRKRYGTNTEVWVSVEPKDAQGRWADSHKVRIIPATGLKTMLKKGYKAPAVSPADVPKDEDINIKILKNEGREFKNARNQTKLTKKHYDEERELANRFLAITHHPPGIPRGNADRIANLAKLRKDVAELEELEKLKKKESVPRPVTPEATLGQVEIDDEKINKIRDSMYRVETLDGQFVAYAPVIKNRVWLKRHYFDAEHANTKDLKLVNRKTGNTYDINIEKSKKLDEEGDDISFQNIENLQSIKWRKADDAKDRKVMLITHGNFQPGITHQILERKMYYDCLSKNGHCGGVVISLLDGAAIAIHEGTDGRQNYGSLSPSFSITKN